MSEKIEIKEIALENVVDIVKIHEKAFVGFFLTSLGTSFLETYYKAVLASLDSIVVGAYVGNKLIGFGIGAIVAHEFHKKLLLKNIFSFGREAFKLFFLKPNAIRQLRKNFTKKGNSEDTGLYTELLSIAVDPSMVAKGIGTVLIKSFEQEAEKNGARNISLTTDYCDNEKVLSFYKRNGYEVFYEFTTYPDRKMYRLIKRI